MHSDPGTRPITTPRLLLRRFTVADAAPMFGGWASHGDYIRFMRWNPHENAAETAALLRDWVFAYEEEPDTYNWAICRRDTGELVGSVGCILHDGTPEPGYSIAQNAQGQGFAREALKAALAYLVDAGGAERFIACHATANPASGKVLRAAGFVPDHEGSYESYDHTRTWPCQWYRLKAADVVRDNPVSF